MCGGERAYDHRDRALAIERLKDVVETRAGGDSRRVGQFPSLALGEQARHRRQHRDARRRDDEHPSPRPSVGVEYRHQENAEAGADRGRQAAEALAACAARDREFLGEHHDASGAGGADDRVERRFEISRTKAAWSRRRRRCCKRESRPCTRGSCGGVRSDRSCARGRARRGRTARSMRTGGRCRRRRDGS